MVYCRVQFARPSLEIPQYLHGRPFGYHASECEKVLFLSFGPKALQHVRLLDKIGAHKESVFELRFRDWLPFGKLTQRILPGPHPPACRLDCDGVCGFTYVAPRFARAFGWWWSILRVIPRRVGLFGRSF